MTRFRRSPLPHLLCWTSCLALVLATGRRVLASEEHAAAHHDAAPAKEPEPSPEAHATPAEPTAHEAIPPSAEHAPAPAAAAAHTSSGKPATAKTNAHGAHAAAPPPPSMNEEEIRGMMKLGDATTERGDFEAAEISYRMIMNATGVPPNEMKSALLSLARMHRKKGELTKAAAIYEKFLKEYPGDERTPDALLDLGRTLRALGVYDLAINRFYNVINSTLKLPADGFEHYQLLAKTAQFEIAETHFQAGRFEEAGKFFARLRLLDLAPADRARAHFKSAYAQHLQGDNETAIATLRAFLVQWPEDENVPEARYLLAISLRTLNRRQEAFAETLELLRVEKTRVEADPKRWAYWQRRTGNQLANDFYESGDSLNARAIYSGLAGLSTEPSWRVPILYQVALCDERLGNVERARTGYKDIIDLAGPGASSEIAEFSRMATWRLAQLNWREQTGRQISSLFENSPGHPVAPTPVSPPPAAALPAGIQTTALP